MPKLRLKILLYIFNGLLAVKRAIIFLFTSFTRHILEKVGHFLTRFFVFPIYKLFLKTHLQEIGLVKLVFNKILFVGLFIFFGLFLAASESKTYGTAKYISGNESLLFQYLNSGESDYIEEDISDVGFTDTGTQWSLGLIAPAILGDNASVPTYDLIDFNFNTFSLGSPLVLPGVDFGIRHEIIKYAVQPGDTLAGIAEKFGVNIDTLAIENKISVRTILQPGDALNILPVKGISHKVKKGDTIKKIASLYKSDAAKVAEFNGLNNDSDLQVGEIIVIPEGKLPVVPVATRPATQPSSQSSASRPASARVASDGMMWPTINHNITQYFSWRHPGVDVGISVGIAVYAADDGVVEKSGWNSGGYGYMILINHGNGIKTRYGHNSRLFVVAGEEVRKGDVIALSGSTGRSTGPHLHFEVIINGTRVNPFLYVR